MRTNTITIDPVTRVEGHGKITIVIDEAGKVADSIFSVQEFRGFEKFCEGRMLWDMPGITSRICGVCPVSHHLASVKACEKLLGVEPPPAATLLRELLHMGQTIHSHSLHLFFFALPDFLSGDKTNDDRGLFSLMETQKNLARQAIALRKAGQSIVDAVGGGRLHPVSCLPGGMSKPLESLERMELYRQLKNVVKIALRGVHVVKDIHDKRPDTFAQFAKYPSLFMSLTKGEKLELYDGPIRIIDGDGKLVAEFPADDYLYNIEEMVKPTSWTKFPYYKPFGFPGGFYRVAPLARLNIAKTIGTPMADEEFAAYKSVGDGKPVSSNLFYHWARAIELLYAVERAIQLLSEPEIMSPDIRVPAQRKGGKGIGVLEAPRGTLIHHYEADDNGRIVKANFVVSTAHNNEAMNRAVKSVAESAVQNGDIPKFSLNKLEMAIRCFDPCLSCSTHAFGKMPLEVRVERLSGETVSLHRYGGV